MTSFIGVHIGAGQHSGSLETKYKQLCQQASKLGMDVLVSGKTALDAVVEATMVLEDSPLTNAGHGSNLTWDGCVECDASVMDGARLAFGACGAVSGVKNPVLLAKMICQQQHKHLPLGRIPPCLLSGEGAYKYALGHKICTVDPLSLISDKALKSFKHCRRKLDRYEAHLSKKAKNGLDISCQLQEQMDTVGAVCVDAAGNVAVACSSGGLLLKHSGRIGQAAIQGAGCWVEGTVGAVSTGCGEHLMATNLAREVVRDIVTTDCPTTALRHTFTHSFLEAPVLRGVEERLAGLLVLDASGGRGELLYAHSTQSMCIGYMSSQHKKPKSRMSRLPEGSKPGNSVVIEGVCF